MRKSIGLIATCIALSGCALTPRQEAAITLTARQFCIFEPVTTKFVGVWDKRKGTQINIDKVDETTRILCEQLIKP